MFILKGFVVGHHGHLGPSINYVLVYVSELETQEGASFRISLFIPWCFFFLHPHLPRRGTFQRSKIQRKAKEKEDP
jgi:hypothetical protein